ncbi:MAG: SGNH/GDSL hydrolase family protein, partial [Lachnospiraceae bacterium]|nr:SGNH/GDSL hydrolase family protein [Lachnospiraceae bacterium]
DKFRERLIDRFEQTSVSVINAGIAGDNLISMVKRADRDVIRYQPDLVLINGSLNWNASMGTTEQYAELLTGLVRKIKAGTDADIILLTPNGDLPNTTFEALGIKAEEVTTPERCEVIRRIAEEEQVCLADVRKVWDRAADLGCPWKELLANGVNHPSVEGHEVYADVLMQLLD